MAKKNRLIIAVLLLLIIAVAILALLNRPEGQLISGQLDIMQDGELLTSYSVAELQSLPASQFEKDILSANFADESGLWSGVALATLLDDAAPGWQDSGCSMIAARAEDGYVIAFDISEALADGNIYICWLLNGEPLGTMDDGGSGPLRVIVREDEFGTRCARWLCRLELI
ncbi:MAG: molybdopterin-dependent oxidoreductase [Bacillota bacterium]|nr:molybdopterin-dependent oxidoreductase [Bacillota bacterium]